VTALHIGFMDTDMVADIDAPKNDPATALDGQSNLYQSPLRRARKSFT
jgi:hypothetical protein